MRHIRPQLQALWRDVQNVVKKYGYVYEACVPRKSAPLLPGIHFHLTCQQSTSFANIMLPDGVIRTAILIVTIVIIASRGA